MNSIFKSSGGLELEVIVIDNASTDESCAMLIENFPHVRLIQNKENLGFSAANNQAIEFIRGEYTLILNPDTLLSEDTLFACFQYMTANPSVGAMGVKMLDGAGNFHKESKRGYPSMWASLCRMSGLYTLFPKSKTFNGYYQGHIQEDQIAETEVLCGAFMFMPSKVFKELDGFDEAFFMYGEDIDLSYRIANSGYKLMYYPLSSIIHYKGESRRSVDSRYVKSFYGSMHIFLRKHSKGFLQNSLLPVFSILIAFKAGYTYLANTLKNFIGPILDLILICLSQLLIKDAWERFYFNDVTYYNERNVLLVIVCFSIIFVLVQYLAGKYDEKYSLKNLSLGYIISALIVFLIYAILPPELRFSRVLIIAGSIVSLLVLIVTLSVQNYLRKGKLGLNVVTSKSALLIGSEESAKSLAILAQGNKLGSNLIGYLNDFDSSAMGKRSNLNDVLLEIPIDEIVFSAKDIDYKFMQEKMAKLGSRYEYKILSEDSMSLLSSNFANKKGSIYTIQTGFNIDEPVNRRLKRGFDFIFGLLLLVFSPILLMRKMKFPDLLNICKAVIGTRTLVSYEQNNIDFSNFPKIKKGVFKLRSEFNNIEQEELFCINFAKNHSVYLELEQLLKAIF